MERKYRDGQHEANPEGSTYADRGGQILALCQSRGSNPFWGGSPVKTSIWQAYQEGPADIGPRMPQAATWNLLTSDVRVFCQQAGSPHTSIDPLENIAVLRAHTAQKTASPNELLKTLENLQRENHNQQRIIASLSLRHFLENLPAPGENWQSTWFYMWNNLAKKEGQPLPVEK